MQEITQLLHAMEQGEPQAAGKLLPLVYDELRALAARKLSHESPGQTLQPTALVHEAYQRLVGSKDSPRWESVGHFFAAASEAMRRILIEVARRKRRRQAKVGHAEEDALDNLAAPVEAVDDLLALDEALTLFAEQDPLKAQLVTLRFYGGLSVEEAARCLGISRATADRYWAYARAWLYNRLQGANPEKSSRIS